MPFFLLLLIICAVAVYWAYRANSSGKLPSRSQDWLSTGGVLGMAIMLSRATRLPLATILSSLPFVLAALRQAERKQSAMPSAPAIMTREEAALILGVPANASEQAIREAHRRLIQKNHPDTGGTDYLAAKINQARDVLLDTQ